MAQTQLSPKLATFLKWTAGLGVAAILAPVLVLAVKGVVSAIIALALGTLAIKFAPAFGTIASNYAMKLLRWDARKNPIETRWNIYKENVENAKKYEGELLEFNGGVEQYESQVADMVAKYPKEAFKYQKHLEAMKVLRDKRYNALAKTVKKLEEYKEETIKLSTIWDMSQHAKNMEAKAGLISEKDAILQIREFEANSSVFQAMSDSFAQVDHLMRTEVPTLESLSLENNPSEIIDVVATPVHQAAVIPLKKAS